MNTEATVVRRRALPWAGPVIDTDVHVEIDSVRRLYPHLDDVWIQHIEERQWNGPPSSLVYPPTAPSSVRDDWRGADCLAPESSLAMLRDHVLDPLAVDHAILNCVFPIDAGPTDFSVALARAANDWLIATFLEADPRLRASLVLPARNSPAAMAEEVDRVGGHPGFVQALLPVRSGMPWGKRAYWPLFAALERHDLVAGIHWGGSNDGLAPTPSGWPSWYVEEYVGEVGVYEAQLLSLLAEGVFQRFPQLRVSLLEIGFTWVPMWLWDLDRNWKALRRETPWLRQRPFEIVRERVRFTTAPLDADAPEQLRRVVDWLGSEDLLMFASDYPHSHGDDVGVLLAAVPETMRAKVMAESARDWYRLP